MSSDTTPSRLEDVRDRIRDAFTFGEENAWAILGTLLLVGAALPQLGVLNSFRQTLLIQMYIFSILALSWDLLGGQTGYPSFGNMAFFGVGAYTAAILVKDFGVAFPVAYLAAGVLALVFAGIIGLAVLRLRGGYFAIATLGVLLASIQIARNLGITGGASGKILINTPDDTLVYYLTLVLLAVEVGIVFFLTRTRFGYVLNAIRDDEGKATSLGINTTYYKTTAWGLSALFTGIAGGIWAPFNTFVDPQTAFNLAWNVEFIAMALIGGTGTVAGPVVGGSLLWLSIYFIDSTFPGWQLVVLGAVIIGTVVFFPKGLIGTLREYTSAMDYYEYGGGAAGDERGTEDEIKTTDDTTSTDNTQ